jgi:hypothetical protein
MELLPLCVLSMECGDFGLMGLSQRMQLTKRVLTIHHLGCIVMLGAALIMFSWLRREVIYLCASLCMA